MTDAPRFPVRRPSGRPEGRREAGSATAADPAVAAAPRPVPAPPHAAPVPTAAEVRPVSPAAHDPQGPAAAAADPAAGDAPAPAEPRDPGRGAVRGAGRGAVRGAARIAVRAASLLLAAALAAAPAPTTAQTATAQTGTAEAAASPGAPGAALPEQTTPARAAIVKDLQSGAILLEKNADAPLPTASMSKLMTLYMIFDALETGRLHLEDEFRTSARAASIGGSRMFIREGEVVSVENLLRGVVVQSGNDASVALAEALAGTEEAFAALMNQRAREIGLTNSNFVNATGWPHPDHYASVRDLATLAERIIRDFPDHYRRFSQTEFTWDGITQRNRNPLLYADIGADGLKTGHTEEAGYGLVASAMREGRRVVLVVSGLESQAQRRQETERLMTWAFRAFDTEVLHRAGDAVLEAEVWVGAEPVVALVPVRDVIVTAPLGRIGEARVTAVWDGPVAAPVAAGTEVGRIEIETPGMPLHTVPLAVAEDVAPGGFLVRIQAAARLLARRAVAAVGL